MIQGMIVPVLNNRDGLRRMLASIDCPVEDLVIVNNDRRVTLEVDKPELVENLWVINLPANLGVAGAWNLGIKSLFKKHWWMITSDDVTFHPGALLSVSRVSNSDSLILCDQWPYWQTFTIGADVVQRIGLFDEMYHPANFEDDDYLRRVENDRNGFTIEHFPIEHDHDAHSTVYSLEYRARKDGTYKVNELYYFKKIARDDYSEGGWSLARRRLQTLD